MYFETRDKDGREKFSQTYSSLTNHIPTKIHLCYLKALTKGIALTFLPAIHIGCSEDVLPSAGSSICTEVLKSAVSTPDKASTLDILIFEDDRLRRLDSYQRIEDFRQMEIYPSSTGGGKIFFFCMNSHRNRYDWADIGSYASLSGISCELEMEDRKNFVKTAEYRCEAGTDMHQVMMSTLVSEIDIENIMCDFYGTPYTDRKITDVRIYLTNVNANCPLIGTESGGEIRMINQGMLNHYDVRKFQDPSMIVQTIDEAIWKYGTSLRKSFVCYPHASNDGRGTRLVIEGKIDGETYFWPFEVGGPEGIEKNCRYIYRINIRRKGTTDPDCLIDPTDVELDLKVKPWSEKEEYCVMF